MSLVYSIKQTGVPLGGVIAGAVLPVLALAMGWNWGLAIVGLACVACALVIAPFRSALDGERSGAVRRPGIGDVLEPVRFTLRDPSLRILGTVSFVFSATQVSLTAYLVTFLTRDLHWQLVAAGLALSVSQAAGVFGRVLWGWVADTPMGSKRTLIVLASAMATSALSVLTLDATTQRWLVVLLMALFGATAVGWNGVFLAAVARLSPPGQTAVVTGGTLAFTYLGVVVGPLLFGVFATGAGSFAIAFAILALPLSLCLVLILRLVNDGRHATSAG
jgi:sugar phosphate permease